MQSRVAWMYSDLPLVSVDRMILGSSAKKRASRDFQFFGSRAGSTPSTSLKTVKDGPDGRLYGFCGRVVPANFDLGVRFSSRWEGTVRMAGETEDEDEGEGGQVISGPVKTEMRDEEDEEAEDEDEDRPALPKER